MLFGDPQLNHPGNVGDSTWDAEALYTGSCLDVRAWDATTFELEGKWPTHGCAKVAAGGEIWAFGSGSDWVRSPGVVEVRQAGSNTVVTRFAVPGMVTGLAITADGSEILVCGSVARKEGENRPTTGFARLVDSKTAAELPFPTMAQLGNDLPPVAGCAMSGDGATVLLAHRSSNLAPTLRILRAGKSHELACPHAQDVQVSSSGAFVAARCPVDVRVWNTQARALVVPSESTDGMSVVADSVLLVGDDRLLLARSGLGFFDVDHGVRMQDLTVRGREVEQRPSGRRRGFSASSLSRDGKHIASLTRGRLEIFRTDVFDKVAPMGKRHHAPIRAVRFLDEDQVITAGSDHWIRRWHVGSGAIQQEAYFEHEPEAIAVFSDGSVSVVDPWNEEWTWTLSDAGPGAFARMKKQPLSPSSCLRRTNTGRVAEIGGKGLLDPEAEWSTNETCAIADDGSRFAEFIIQPNPQWQLRDPLDDAVRQAVHVMDVVNESVLEPISVRARTLALSPDGMLLAVATDRLSFVDAPSVKSLILYDATTGRAVGERMAHDGRITAMAFSPSGRRLVTAGEDGLAVAWDVAQLVTMRRGDHDADAP